MKRTTPAYKRVLQHGVAILAIILLASLALTLSKNLHGEPTSFGWLFMQVAVGVVLFILPPIYFSMGVLVPHQLVPRRYWLFGRTLTIVCVTWGWLVSYLEPITDQFWFGEPYVAPSPENGIAVITFTTLFALMFNLSYRWLRQLTHIRRLENEQLTRELALLKSQMSPHFFFNTLNNLYALSLDQSDQTPEVILKLADLMRYTLYDCRAAQVPISSEVQYLENYLALQQIRQFEGGDVRFDHQVQSDGTVAPMLLIVLVENAFKHGLEALQGKGHVHIKLMVETEKLQFSVTNTKGPQLSQSGGLGLENLRQRLQLLYPDQHSVHIQEEETTFTAQLTLHL